MKILSLVALIMMSFLQLQAQIWDAKNIDFSLPSQGWRVHPVDEKVAWTFGFSIEEDPFEGWAFTDSENSCQKTLDGGSTWEEMTFKPLEEGAGYICDIEGISDQVAFVTYYNYIEGPILYKTTNGGASWTANKSVVDLFLNWVQFYDNNNGIAFGDPGVNGYFEIAYTTDGGATWTLLEKNQSIKASEADEYGVFGNYAASGNYIFTRSDYDRIFFSSDKGRSWQVADPPQSAIGALWGLVCNDRADLIAAYNIETSNEFILFKRDVTNGEWTDITPLNSSGYLAGMSTIPGTETMLINKHEDFADNQSFVTLASVDGGASWLEVSKDQGFRTGFMEFYNTKAGYACEIPADFANASDQVFVYNQSLLTGLYSQQMFSTALYAYPNPANHFINLDLESEDVCDYYILVHDTSGRLLEKKVILHTSGLHEQLPVDHLPGGEYMVTVSNSKGFASTKFVK